MIRRPPRSTLFPYTPLSRPLATVLARLYIAPPPDIESREPLELARIAGLGLYVRRLGKQTIIDLARVLPMSIAELLDDWLDRKSTRLNSSHSQISYAVFCLK